MSAHPEDLDQLRDHVRRLTEELAQVQHTLSLASPALPPTSPTSPAAAADEAPALSPATSTSRRSLLKWGGVSAAAALAAAGAVGLSQAPTAHASDGQSLVLGTTSTAENSTTLTYDGGDLGVSVLIVNGTNNANTAILASGGPGGIGVYGVGSDGAPGINGQSDSGPAVRGVSNASADLVAGGTGRIQQYLANFVGAPTMGTYNAGEQIRDENGDLFLCVAGGTPGTWQKVAALNTSFRGGATAFLSTPIRVYDSRQTGGPLVGNAARAIQVTGVTIGGVSVPAGAVGCVGNLTVTNTTQSGYVVIYPQGSATPTTSTVNFLKGQTTANSFMVGLSGSGQVTVHSFTSGQCDFIVDITGFVS